ncbi:MAG: protein BatD [Gammaproteobacteria bacterium]|nr:protein BatD [Gammaproteobacteria bacterium]
MVKQKSIAFLFVALLASIWAPAAMAEIEVSVDRNPVRVNEAFSLVFSLEQSPDREPDFSSLQQHFLILDDSTSKTFSFINGEYRRTVRYSLRLMPKQIGEFMIPAIRFDHERSKPFQVTVKASSSPESQDQLVFEVLSDKPEAYVQSQVILTLRLLSASPVSGYQFGDVTIENLDAVIEPLGEVREYETRIGDKPYQALEQKIALFPQQAGRLEVAPVLARVRLLSNSHFDPFRRGGEIQRLRSLPVSIDIEPVPPDVKAPYWLPARRLELRENWQGDLNALVAGEPVTRSLIMIVDGLTAAQLPELALAPIDGIKQYPDQPVLDNSRSNDGIQGKRVQKVALIPGAEGSYRVPEINISWWNLKKGQLEVATIPERELIVSAAATAPTAAPAATTEAASATPSPAVESNPFWLWLSLLLACGWGLSALYWRYRTRRSTPLEARPLEQPSIRQARAGLRRACNENNAVDARTALLPWGQALLAPREVNNLHQLRAAFGSEFAQQVEDLNLSLYARSRQNWQGAGLLQLCQQLERRYTHGEHEKNGLMPLNPSE